MAKKLNRNLVGGLTLFGALLVGLAGFALLRSLPGHDPKVYEAQAKELEEKGELDRAALTYIRAFQRDPQQDPEYLVKAAHCYDELGQVREARELLAQARVKNPSLRSAAEMSTQIELDIAKVFGTAMMWTRVKDEAEKLLTISEQSPLGKAALAMAYANLRGGDADLGERSKAALREALKLDPANPDIIELLVIREIGEALVRADVQDREEAKRLLEEGDTILSQAQAQATDKTSKEFSELRRMDALYRVITASIPSQRDEARLKEGLARLEQIAAEESQSPNASLSLISLRLGIIASDVTKDNEGAEKVARSALERFPKDGRLYVALGQVLQRRRIGERDPAKLNDIRAAEVKVFKDGLANVARATTLRKQFDNSFRNLFFRELFLHDIDRAQRADLSEADREAALASAEEWVNKLKAEEDPQSLIVRVLSATLYNARGERVRATAEAEAADRLLGASDDILLQLLLGDLYTQQQQWGNARKALEKAMSIRNDQPIVYIRLAQVYLAMNDAAQAIQYLKATKPDTVRAALETSESATRLRVEAYRQLNQLALAEEESKKLQGEGSSDEILDARLLISGQKYGEAEAKLKSLIAANPNEVDAVRLLVQMYRDTDRAAEARQLVDSLAAANPDIRAYRGMKVGLMEGESSSQDAATLAYIGEEPDPFVREMMLADFYTSQEKYDEAMKHLDAAEGMKPDNGQVIERQFRLAVVAKNWDRANRYVAKDGELNLDGSGGRICQGRLALAKGEPAKAIELMRSGLAAYPSNSIGWTFLAEAYVANGNRTEARAALQRALEIDPTNGFANRGMAEMALREGDEKAGEKYLAAAARVMPEEPWVKRQSQILKEKENPEQGIAAREKIRREDPQNLENLVLLARLYGDRKVAQFDKAAEVYREALAVSKNNLVLAQELANFLGRDDVNRPAEGDALLVGMLRDEEDKKRRAQISIALGMFCENQKQLATADRHFRFAVEQDPSPEVLNACGEFNARTNRHKESVEYYKRLIEAAKDDAVLVQTTRARICALYLAMGDLDEAKAAILEFEKAYPTDPQGLIYMGAYHRIGGDIQKAKEAFDRLLEKSPDNATALWQRGQLNMLQGRWQAAAEDLQKSKAYAPKAFFYQHRIMLANVFVELDQAGAAILELKSILDEDPDQDPAVHALVDVYCTMRPPRYSDAENLLFTIMRSKPTDPQWPMLLGRVAEREVLGKSAEEIQEGSKKAAKAYEQAAELSRYRAETVSALFRVWKSAVNPQAIIAYADSKLSTRLLTSMPPELAMVGWAYNRVGQRERALERFDQAMIAAGQDFLVYSRVVNEMIGALGKEETLKRVRAQAEANPENLDKQKALIHMLHADQKAEEAVALCEKVLKLSVRNEDKLFALVGAGMLLEQINRYEEAKARYEEALKIEPNEPTALNNLAYLLVERLKRPAEALPYAEHVNKLARRTNANALDTLGWAQAEMGRLREGVGTLLRALEVDKDNVAAQYHLAMIHKRLGEREEAIARLKSAQKSAEFLQSKSLAPEIESALRELEAGSGS